MLEEYNQKHFYFIGHNNFLNYYIIIFYFLNENYLQRDCGILKELMNHKLSFRFLVLIPQKFFKFCPH